MNAVSVFGGIRIPRLVAAKPIRAAGRDGSPRRRLRRRVLLEGDEPRVLHFPFHPVQRLRPIPLHFAGRFRPRHALLRPREFLPSAICLENLWLLGLRGNVNHFAVVEKVKGASTEDADVDINK